MCCRSSNKNPTVATLKKMSTGENFCLFWEDVRQKDVDALKLSRKRRAPTRVEEFFSGKAAPEYVNDVVSHYHIIYFESLDCIISAIEDRFDQEDSRTYFKFENLFFESS